MRTLLSKLLPALLVVLLALVVTVIGAACNIEPDHGEACYPGDYRACLCETGARGLAQCAVDGGGGYGACNCTPPAVDAASDAPSGDDAGDSGLLGFLSACAKNEDCSTGLCFPFNAKGPHCTRPCQTDSDCAPPSPGCSNNKVCKLP